MRISCRRGIDSSVRPKARKGGEKKEREKQKKRDKRERDEKRKRIMRSATCPIKQETRVSRNNEAMCISHAPDFAVNPRIPISR